MASSSGRFGCDLCGAVLPIPADDAILSVKCSHCQHEQLVPDAERRREAQAERREREEEERERRREADSHATAVRSSSRMTTWITLGSFVFAIAIAAITAGPSVMQTWTAVSAPVQLAPTTIPVAAPVSAPPVPIAVTPIATGPSAAQQTETARARVAELMRARVQSGCGRVIMPPEIVTGAKGMTAELVQGRHCIEIFAVAGAATNPLTLTMQTPFGESIATPPAGAEVHFRHCPTVAGPHPARATPATGDPFALAAIECPRR